MLFLAANFAPFKIDFHTDDLDAFGITGTPANFIAVSKKLKKHKHVMGPFVFCTKSCLFFHFHSLTRNQDVFSIANELHS
jgi:hypothetical protein